MKTCFGVLCFLAVLLSATFVVCWLLVAFGWMTWPSLLPGLLH